MDQVFIKKEELNYWIAKYFKGDLISIEDMLAIIEDLDGEVDILKEELNRYEQNHLQDN